MIKTARAKPAESNESLVVLVKESGDARALAQLVEQNRAILYKVAMPLVKRCHSLALEDLVQEGRMGLMHAVTKYNVNKGANFLTYAMWWIKQYMFRAAAMDSTQFSASLWARELSWSGRLGRRRRALAAEGLTPEQIDETIAAKGGARSSKHTIASLRVLSRNAVFSMDEPLEQDDGEICGRHESLSNGDDPVDEIAARLEFARRVRERIAKLRPYLKSREHAILDRRLLGGAEGQRDETTLADIGRATGLSRERVRQFETELVAYLQLALADLCEMGPGFLRADWNVPPQIRERVARRWKIDRANMAGGAHVLEFPQSRRRREPKSTETRESGTMRVGGAIANDAQVG